MPNALPARPSKRQAVVVLLKVSLRVLLVGGGVLLVLLAGAQALRGSIRPNPHRCPRLPELGARPAALTYLPTFALLTGAALAGWRLPAVTGDHWRSLEITGDLSMTSR